MSDKVSLLSSLAHELLTLGQDGSPIYVDHFARMNREVYEQALCLYDTHGSTPESEAELCQALLAAFNATIYDNGRKQQHIRSILERSLEVLPRLSASLLKVRLLTFCYGEVYEETMLQEARSIISGWDSAQLTDEQREIIEELQNIEDNPYPWEYVD